MVLALRPATVSFPSTRLFRPRYFQVQFLCVPESLRVMSTIRYPEIRRDDLVENLHGVKVPDPYRWLEDPKCEDTRVISHDNVAADSSNLLMSKMLFVKITSPSFPMLKRIAKGSGLVLLMLMLK